MPLLLAAALVVGILIPLQAGVNAQLRHSVGHPVVAALVSFLVGTIALALVMLGFRIPLGLGGAWARVPWWQWIGGLIGVIVVGASIMLAQRLGAATFVAVVVAGQMLSGLLLDQYGLIGFEQHSISVARVVGGVLVIGGMLLIQR